MAVRIIVKQFRMNVRCIIEIFTTYAQGLLEWTQSPALHHGGLNCGVDHKKFLYRCVSVPVSVYG